MPLQWHPLSFCFFFLLQKCKIPNFSLLLSIFYSYIGQRLFCLIFFKNFTNLMFSSFLLHLLLDCTWIFVSSILQSLNLIFRYFVLFWWLYKHIFCFIFQCFQKFECNFRPGLLQLYLHQILTFSFNLIVLVNILLFSYFFCSLLWVWL